MRTCSTLLAFAAAALVLAGCGGDSTAPAATSHVGRYALVSVDGGTLPLTVFDTPALKLIVTNGSITLNENNTFAEIVQVDVVANGFPAPPELGTCNGTYQRTGNAVALTSTASQSCTGGTTTGTLDGKTLTVSSNNSTLVFRR